MYARERANKLMDAEGQMQKNRESILFHAGSIYPEGRACETWWNDKCQTVTCSLFICLTEDTIRIHTAFEVYTICILQFVGQYKFTQSPKM